MKQYLALTYGRRSTRYGLFKLNKILGLAGTELCSSPTVNGQIGGHKKFTDSTESKMYLVPYPKDILTYINLHCRSQDIMHIEAQSNKNIPHQTAVIQGIDRTR